MRKTDYDEDTYYQMVERDLKPLILITQKAEELIADHVLVKTEDLWDEDYDQVVRALFFEKGTRGYIITITQDELIRASHTKYPSQLSTQPHNLIMGLCVGGWVDDPIKNL
ncbi:hypothetical protein OAZ88_00360 [bacterium]|nr:hypothetical protein [bacterium]